MKDDRNRLLREQVLELLTGRGAHADFDAAISGIPPDLRGKKPPNVPHTLWRLLEHMRLAQFDILDFCLNSGYRERKFPDDYWPSSDAPSTEDAWNAGIESFHNDLERVKGLVGDPRVDLLAKIPWGDGQTYLREALLVADHNAYHIGELVTLRRALKAWD